jgi:hypothetical protein
MTASYLPAAEHDLDLDLDLDGTAAIPILADAALLVWGQR